mgnify:FL=1
MGILGQPFADWVTKQINARQTSLGNSTNLTTTNLLYQNTKAPWIRLSSSVNVSKAQEDEAVALGTASEGDGNFSKLKSYGIPASILDGDNIAKNLILQGGTMAIEGNSGVQNFGLNSSNAPLGGAYGWGGLEERGYVPMPGITDATVQYLENGAFSKTVINFKCFSRKQLAMLDVLYMRPGFNLLLEFGWSTYLDNSGTLQKYDNFFSPALSYMFEPKAKGSSTPTHFDVLDLIQQERIDRQGNYEGVFGKVVNFGWSFNSDGSYDCRTEITGMGDMMESLKVNIKLPSKADNDVGESTATPAGEVEQPPLIANKTKTTLNKVLYNLYEQTSGAGDADAFWTVTLPSSPLAQVIVKDDNAEQTTEFKLEDLSIKSGMLSVQGVTMEQAENASPQVYLTFGTLIAIVQKYLLVYNNDGCPLFDFDVDFKNIEKDTTYMVTAPGHFSANPLVCLIPYTNTNMEVENITYPDTKLNETMTKIASNFQFNTYLGRLMHVYLNINNIATILDKSPRDSNGGLSLLTFLNSVIDTMSASLGYITQIGIKVDEVTGKIKFIENAPQRFDNSTSDKVYAKFNAFGVKPNTASVEDQENEFGPIGGGGGSFVKNLVMSGELGAEYASMITIGAQYGGNELSANATGFSKYNLGLIDRVIPVKKNQNDYEQSSEKEDEEAVVLEVEDVWNQQINYKVEGTSVFESIYQLKNFLEEDISCLNELSTNYFSLMFGKLVKDKQLQAPSFLPFNLSMDITGLSGMKLFERFSIDDRVLPPSYGEGNVELLIKSLNHTIGGEGWMTKVDTQAVPVSKMNPIKSPGPMVSSTAVQASTNTSSAPVGSIGDFKTLTSGFPMAKIFYDGPTPKKQIYIHHTAGATKSPSRTIAGWSKRTDHVATHYITNNLGDKEQLYADEAWANHLGIKQSVFSRAGVKFQNLNKISLGIEMQSYGWCDLKNGKYITYYKNELSADRVGRPIGKDGSFISYKGHKYYEKYNSANIAHVKTIVTGWMSKYGIPFHYDYDQLFPNLGESISKKALRGEKGVFTHNSVRTGKSDVWPQKELIDMLKSIATSGA